MSLFDKNCPPTGEKFYRHDVAHGDVKNAIKENPATSRNWIYIMVGVWVAVLAVADMNWPSHIGGSNHLMQAVGLL